MKGLSSIERIILECLGKHRLTYNEIQLQTGLHENVCFNVLQALIIRNLVTTDGVHYRVSERLSPLMMEEINGADSKVAETLELVEAVVETNSNKVFKLRKVAMDERDEKIFLAMLTNLEAFIADAHKKAEKVVPLKERKIVFWGMGEVQTLMNQIVTGR
jgi:hypothetical protein